MADLPDPSTLTDEELDKILAGEEPEEPVETQEPNEEHKPEESVDPVEDEEAGEPKEGEPEVEGEPNKEEPKNPEEPKPSRREVRRIHQILNKYGDPDKPKQTPETKGTIDYEKELDADPELLKRLQADRQQTADQSFQKGLELANSIEFRTRLEIEAPRVNAKYPQLDKESELFKPNAASDINVLYLQLVGWNPDNKTVQNNDLHYSDFVDAVFAIANDIADDKAKAVANDVKRVASQTGVRPNGQAIQKLDFGKAPQDMTDEELDAVLKANNLL